MSADQIIHALSAGFIFYCGWKLGEIAELMKRFLDEVDVEESEERR